MLKAFVNAFKIPDLRKKILFTIGIIAVFPLGIMPYITSSIIMQLLTVVIPKLEQWQKQGEIGIKKITQWTRYMTVTLALLQSTGLVFLFNSPQFTGGATGIVRHFTPPR